RPAAPEVGGSSATALPSGAAAPASAPAAATGNASVSGTVRWAASRTLSTRLILPAAPHAGFQGTERRWGAPRGGTPNSPCRGRYRRYTMLKEPKKPPEGGRPRGARWARGHRRLETAVNP